MLLLVYFSGDLPGKHSGLLGSLYCTSSGIRITLSWIRAMPLKGESKYTCDTARALNLHCGLIHPSIVSHRRQRGLGAPGGGLFVSGMAPDTA